MEQVRLGATGLRVSRICLGTMAFGTGGAREWHLGEETVPSTSGIGLSGTVGGVLTAKGTATRGRIIDAAAAEIRERGVGVVTLDDIGRRSRTGKSQLFHYFPDGKEELLLAVAEREADRVLEDQQPQLGQLTTWDAWREWRDVVVEKYRRQGVNCPLGVLITEIGRHTPAAQAVTAKLLAQWQHRIQAGIEEMKAAGEIRSDVDPARASAALVAAIQGGVAILMSSGSAQHLEYALDLCLDYLRVSSN